VEASRQARRRRAAALAAGASCQRRRGLLAREARRRATAQAGGRAGGAGQRRRLRPAEVRVRHDSLVLLLFSFFFAYSMAAWCRRAEYGVPVARRV